MEFARQAEQIPVDIPGWLSPGSSYRLTLVLIEAGDLAAAELVCAAGLVGSRAAGDLMNLGSLLPHMAVLDLHAGRTEDAAAHLAKGSRSRLRTGGPGTCSTAWTAAGTCAPRPGASPRPSPSGPHRTALHQQRRTECPPTRAADEPLREARQALGPARARAAEERGAAMSLATAAEYALMLTAPESLRAAGPAGARQAQRAGTGTGHPGRPGPHRRADRRELYISIRTVRSHLDRIRDKTGCRRRADLTRLALSEGLV